MQVTGGKMAVKRKKQETKNQRKKDELQKREETRKKGEKGMEGRRW